MMRRPPLPQRVTILILVAWPAGLLRAVSTATAPHAFVISVAAEKKLKQLSAGPMFWQVKNFSTLAEANDRRGPDVVGNRSRRQGLALHPWSDGQFGARGYPPL